MNLRTKIGLGVLVGLILTFFHIRNVRQNVTTVNRDDQPTITIKPGGTTITYPKPGGKDDTIIIPDYGHGTVIDVDKNKVRVKPRMFGFSNDFGLSTDFNRLGLGWEIGYYKRFALLVGSNFWHMHDQSFDVRFYVAGAYRLPWKKVSNVSLYAGVDNRKVVTGGLFLRFGSS